MQTLNTLRGARQATARSTTLFVQDVGRGLLELGHNTFALFGLGACAVLVFALGKPDIRGQVEVHVLQWLQTRHEAREQAADAASDDAALNEAPEQVAENPPATTAAAATVVVKDLTRPQALLASWIARRYKVAPEPIGALVQEAWSMGQRAGLDPTLILAIMAVESSFNPFAQSPVGAQGLMQVMTRVHDDKYHAFGGTRAAFDPISNLRVGVQVLKECILRAGSLHDGLKRYVGAALIEGDGGYVGRVLAEQLHMRQVADGKRVPPNSSAIVVPTAAVKAAGGAPMVQPVARQEPAPAALPAAAEPDRAASAEQVALLR